MERDCVLRAHRCHGYGCLHRRSGEVNHTLTITHDGERYLLTIDGQPPWQTVFAWAMLEKLHQTLAKWKREGPHDAASTSRDAGLVNIQA